jgi:hypothetical protein
MAYIRGREERMAKGAVAVEEKEEVLEEAAADNFDDFFDEAIAEDGGEEPTEKAEEPEGEAEEEPTSEEAEEEEPVEEKPKEEPEGEETPKEDKVEKTDDGETLETLNHKYKTLQGMYNSVVQKAPKVDEPKEEGDEPKPTEEESKDDFKQYTAELVESIGKIESVKAVAEEHGEEVQTALADVASFVAENVMSKMSEKFEAKFGQLSDVVNPIRESHAKTADEAHFEAVTSAHPDFDTYIESGELREWVESQQGLNKKIYTEAYDDGDTQDVIDLVAAFRDSKGYAEKKEEPEEKKETKSVDQSKLEDMEAIESKKSPVTTGKSKPSKGDFDAGWDEA